MELFESDSRVVSKALVGHKNQVTCSKFAGENVLSASLDRTVRLWKSVLEEEDSEVVCTHPEGVLSMGKTSKDEKIISGSKHGDIYLQDLESGVFLAKHNVGSSVVGLDIEDHGRIFIAAVVAYPEVLIWDLRSGSHPVRIKSVHGKAITSCCILRGEDRIITTSLDKTARVYDLRSNETTLTLRYHSNAVSCTAVSPDNRVLVTGSWDRELFLFDLNTGAYRTGGPVALKGGHTGCVKCCAISDDGCHVMSGGMENNMSVWNSVSGRKLTTLEGHSGDVNSVSIRSDGELGVSASNDKTLRLWSLHDVESMAYSNEESTNKTVPKTKCLQCDKNFIHERLDARTKCQKCPFCRQVSQEASLQ